MTIIKTKKDFDKLIDKNKYQVFLVSTPIPRPASFAIHTYFVTNEKGNINRWEVWQLKKINKTSYEHLHKNLFPYWQGIRKYPTNKIKKRFSVKIIDSCEGKITHEIISIIKKSPKKYTLKNQYKTLGPNSNSYIQWIINQVPQNSFKLPWNAIGKNYFKKSNKTLNLKSQK